MTPPDQLSPTGASAQNDPPSQADLDIETLIVAVHGIGNQYRYATIQAVAHRVASYFGPPIGIPLGSFHSPNKKTRARAFEGRPHLGLAEVYWANIPRDANKDKDTLEEAKAWAQTVVQRVRAMDHATQLQKGKKPGTTLVDYDKTSAVVSEMVDTIGTLENLTFVAEKAGLMKFNLRELLDDYLGDVQIVAEFRDYGGNIFKQFQSTMAELLKAHPNVNAIHIVAHSEGTVVTFKGLLEALSKPNETGHEWVKFVKSLMTIGSPIDKHIVMWPALWEGLAPDASATRPAGNGILWWNYYDFGDPVGFELDTAREWLLEQGWIAPDPQKKKADGSPLPADRALQRFFDFPEKQEKGFTRYPFPGKAHNDYWGDKELFDHFLSEGMKLQRDNGFVVPVPVPKTKGLLWLVSWVLPYLLIAALLILGTYLVYDNVEDVIKVRESNKQMPWSVLGLASLLAGITVLGRLPRLVRVGPWYLLPLILFPLGALAYWHLVEEGARNRLGEALWAAEGDQSRWAVILVALAIALLSALFSKVRPNWGMRPLMFLSGAVVVFVVSRVLLLNLPAENPNAANPKLWPVILAAAAFLYLWWLAAHLFDLVFVWHRYIRTSLANKILKTFHR